MLTSGQATRGRLSRGSVHPHFTTGCAFATAGILVCGFVAPSVEASGVRSEVRVVQLASLTGPAANPLGVLVGKLPERATTPGAELPVGGPADVPISVQPDIDLQSAAAAVPVAEAIGSYPTIGTWVVMTVVESVAAIGRLFPENDPIRLFFAAFVLFGAFVGVGVVAPIIDAVLSPVLSLFGIGMSSAASLSAVEPIEPSIETFTSEPVQSTADEVNGETAKAAELGFGDGAESVAASTEPEDAVSEQVPAEVAEPTETTEVAEAVAAVEVEPAVAEEVEANPTEPQAEVEEEVATDAVDPAEEVTEAVEPESEPETATAAAAESVTAPEDSTTEGRDTNAGAGTTSGNPAAADSSAPAPSSQGSDSSGDTAGS